MCVKINSTLVCHFNQGNKLKRQNTHSARRDESYVVNKLFTPIERFQERWKILCSSFCADKIVIIKTIITISWLGSYQKRGLQFDRRLFEMSRGKTSSDGFENKPSRSCCDMSVGISGGARSGCADCRCAPDTRRLNYTGQTYLINKRAFIVEPIINLGLKSFVL